jgi:hypothetical protein
MIKFNSKIQIADFVKVRKDASCSQIASVITADNLFTPSLELFGKTDITVKIHSSVEVVNIEIIQTILINSAFDRRGIFIITQLEEDFLG